MPAESMTITTYQYYQFSTREDWTKAVCICFGPEGKAAYLYFQSGTQPLPAASKSGNNYYLYYRYSDMANVIDMLRNEKPIYLYYIPEGTNNSRISTTSEPVGEGEQA